jgi:hypothetical protein
MMSTFSNLLPPAARPYSEVILGAGAGALVAHFGRFTSAKRGALYGAALGLGVSLLKPSYPYYGPRFFAGQFDYGRWPRDWQQPDWRRYSDEWRNRGWGHHW